MPKKKEEAVSQESSGKPMWSGTISFGLVSIPVHLSAAVRESRVSLRMLDRDGTPLARRYFSAKDGKEISSDHLIRGYEIEQDRFVPITDDELESLAPEKSRDIDLRRFVPEKTVEPMYFERAYFLMPAKESMKAYRLLAETMEKTKTAGIATFVMRDKEYLVAILSEHGFLRAETLRFHDEVRSPQDVALPPIEKAVAKDVQKIEKAMASITEKTLDPKELKSDYTDKLLALVERKRKKGDGVLQNEAAAPKAGSRSVINLMDELQKSLNATRSAKKRSGAPADEELSLKPNAKGHPGKRAAPSKLRGRQKK